MTRIAIPVRAAAEGPSAAGGAGALRQAQGPSRAGALRQAQGPSRDRLRGPGVCLG